MLSWATRIFYTLVYVAFVVNLSMMFAPRMRPHWRFNFGYTSLLLAIYGVYIGLRVIGVLGMQDYLTVVRWLYPFMVFPFITPPLLIHWESKFYQQALKERVDRACQVPPS